jgi:F-type H+-transporting ATPase subunit a
VRLTPDAQIFFEWGFIKLNATLLWSLVVDIALVVGALLATRGITPELLTTRWQAFVEVVIDLIRTQLADITNDDPELYLPFVGTLFLYIAVSNALVIFPLYEPPTGSLSTTSALAVCVLVAVPTFGIRRIGLAAYLRRYIEPSPFLLPFNIIGEISRTVALAIRLFGNIMSGSLMVGMTVALAPFFFPILINLLGLLTGLIQAYIFAVLAVVFIASGSRVQAAAGRPPSELSEST